MTTPVSDRLDRPEPWNLLPTGEDPWPFFLLMDALVDHLAAQDETRLNYTAGETAEVLLPPGQETTNYVLRMPSGEAVRQTAASGRDSLMIGFAADAGAYRVEAGGASSAFTSDFAVNLAPDATDLTRVPFSELEKRLGAERVSLVSGRDALARDIDRGRVGRELYGMMLAFVATVFAVEQVVSNRFYRSPTEPGTTP